MNRSQQVSDLTVNGGERSTRHHGRRSGATQQANEAVDNNDFRHPWYSKCRRPYFWISIGVLAAIITDALFETIMGQSLLGNHHWIAMRVLDLVLSISVFMQSKKLESLLDEKEKFLE